MKVLYYFLKIYILLHIGYSPFLVLQNSEILRAIDSLQLTARQKVATPVDWTVIIYIHYLFLIFSFFSICNYISTEIRRVHIISQYFYF